MITTAHASRASVLVLGLLCLSALAPCLAGCGEEATSPETGRLEGRVVLRLTEDPLPGALVACAGQQRVSDGAGRFVFERVPQGDQLLTAELAGYRAYAATVRVSDLVSLRVPLAPVDTTTDLGGRVFNRVDGAVAQALIRAGGRLFVTGLDGSYLLRDLPQGLLRVVVDHPGYDTLVTEVLLVRPEQTADLRLLRDATIAVPVVRDAEVRTGVGEREQNFGELPLLTVSISSQSMALLDLPDLAGPAAEMRIDAAALRLAIRAEPGSEPGPSCFRVFRILEFWTEMSVTGAAFPAVDESTPALDFTSPNCLAGLQATWSRLDLDVTGDMRSIQAGYEHEGLLLRHFISKAVAGSFQIVSSEGDLVDLRPAVVLSGKL